MLETIREFGLERLEASDEAAETWRRHATYFLALAEEPAPRLSTGELVPALERLSIDLPNLRAALAWSLERGDAESVLRLVSGLVSFWTFRGHVSEGRRWLETALAQPGVRPATRADALFAAAVWAGLQGEHRQTEEFGAEALTISQEHDYSLGIGRSLFVLAFAAERQGEAARAATLYEAALPPLREAGHPRWIAQTLATLADMVHVGGDTDRAATLAEEALRLSRQIGHAWVSAVALGVLAHVVADQGDLERAARLCEESLALSLQLADQRGVAGTLGGLAAIVLARGDAEGAARFLGAARALGDTVGIAHLGHQLFYERVLAATRAGLDEQTFAAAWEAGRALPLDAAVAEALAAARPTSAPAVAGAPPPVAGLTAREREVLRLLAQGRGDKEIAAALGISRAHRRQPRRQHPRQARRRLPCRRRRLRRPPPLRLSALAPSARRHSEDSLCHSTPD